MVDCLLGANGWSGSVGLPARAACGCASPTDPPSDRMPHNARVTWPNDGSGARHNGAELVHYGIDGLENIRRYGSDSYPGEVIPKQLRLRR
jgi:hypothetical protein